VELSVNKSLTEQAELPNSGALSRDIIVPEPNLERAFNILPIVTFPGGISKSSLLSL